LNKKSTGKKSTGKAGAGGAARNVSHSPMDVSLLERLVKLMAANDLNTVDVRDGDKRVILKRGQQIVATNSVAMPVHHWPSPAPAHAPQPSPTTTGPAEIEDGLVPIKSPMVGTFYAAPAPDAKPFVSIGSHVDEETDVCVIEAMKVFNNIKAETTGTIAKILVTNGQTVEYGQALFLVKP
jgi:acetyl-CoA carboxylase biotin carboxyl carrier protein